MRQNSHNSHSPHPLPSKKAPGPSRPGRCCNTIVIIIYTLPGTLFSQFVCNIVSRDQIKLLTNLLYLINQSIFFTFRDCILWEISCLNFGSREGGEGRGERREERRGEAGERSEHVVVMRSRALFVSFVPSG